MPWLSRNQQEQTIGRLGARQSAQIIPNVRTLYHLQHWYNTTNDRPHSGHPWVTTPRQHCIILHHICRTNSPQQLKWLVVDITPPTIAQQWNTEMSHQCRHRPSPLGLQQYPLSMFCWRSYSYKPSPNRPSTWTISSSTLGASSNGEESSSQMKVCSVFQRRWLSMGLVKKRWTLHKCICDGERLMGWTKHHALGSQQFSHNGIMTLQYISQVLRLHIVPYFGRHQHHMFQQDNAHAHTAWANRILVGRNPQKTQSSATKADNCSRVECRFSQNMGRDSNGHYQPPYSLPLRILCVCG